MNKKSKLIRIAVLAGLGVLPFSAYATNGMNLQGYGPVAGAMGGASMAYDNGLAATMNNPATLGLMNGSRLDVALGALIPTVTASTSGASDADSSGGPYVMPAVGYATHNGRMTYGFGVFAQGGMGTDYSANSFLALGTNEKVRSELGVGRFIVPLTYNVNDKLTIGGSVDYVWATLDLKMALTPAAAGGLVTGCTGAACPTLSTTLGSFNAVRLDFSDNNDFSGAAKGSGTAFKLGVVYKIDSTLSFGATYHSKTSMGDLTTSGNGAEFSGYNGSTKNLSSTGKISVRDFQWPETYAIGLAWHASDKMMVVGDIKHIGWSGVMKDFKMTYATSDFGGAGPHTVDMTLPQNWKDQTVFEVGTAYKYSDALTLRGGLNLASNPIPDQYVNPLFPAVFTNHVDIGLGYAFSKASSFDASLVYALKSDATSPANPSTSTPAIKNEVGGYEVMMMYSKRF